MSPLHPTCSTCRHWRRLPADPANLGAAAGERRESVHLVAVPVMTARGPLPSLQTLYARTPPDFPACSRHERPGPACAEDLR